MKGVFNTLWFHSIMQGVFYSVAPYALVASDLMAFSAGLGGLDTWLISEKLVFWYVAHLKEWGFVPRTTQGHMATISLFSKAHSFADPCNNFTVHKAVEG